MFRERLVHWFTSLRLSVACLVLAMVLVFLGTLAQEPLGLYAVQSRFFRSFFVDAGAFTAALHKLADMLLQGFGRSLGPVDAHRLLSWPRLPVFPGGYLIGGVLLINLLASQWRRRQRAPRWLGVTVAALGLLVALVGHVGLQQSPVALSGWFLLAFGLLRLDLVHAGLVLLLVGQLLTDLLAVESTLHLRLGETKNYSEADRRTELAVVDVTEADSDKVVAIPQAVLARQGVVRHPELPFEVRVDRFLANSAVSSRPPHASAPPPATQGLGLQLTVRELPRVTAMNQRDVPSAIVEILTPQGSLGTWLVSEFLNPPQRFTVNGRTWELSLRPQRHYTPHSLKLLEFRHDRYPGTDIPKNFSSRVRLLHPATGEDREVLIYMNNPLRYGGATYYQASYDTDEQGTVLQVVRNPSWLTPYLACLLVSLGLVVQFLTHLFQFLVTRRTA